MRECFWLVSFLGFPLAYAHVSSGLFGVPSIRIIAIFLKLESKREISSPSPNLISCATMQRQPKGPLRSVRKTFPIFIFRGFVVWVCVFFLLVQPQCWQLELYVLYDFYLWPTLLREWSALYLLSSSSALRSVVEGNLAVVKFKK